MDFWEFLWIPLLLACLNISMSICDCPQGFKEIGSKCYYFSSIATTQESAQQACNSKSSKLFEPESSQVLELVKSELDTDDTWWIGLQRDNPESIFTYMSSGEVPADQGVIENIEQSDVENYFICEMNPDPNPSTPSLLDVLSPFTRELSSTSSTSTTTTTTRLTTASTTSGDENATTTEPETTTSSSTTTTTPAPKGQCPFYDGKCSRKGNSWTCVPSEESVQDPTEIKTCYLEVGPVINRRIVGGDDATKGEYPFLASLEECFDIEMDFGGGQKRDVMMRNIFCGGTVISKKHILTAAHCIDNKKPNEIVAVMGGHKFHLTHTDITDKGGKKKQGCIEGSPLVYAKKTIWHPDFKKNAKFDNDFGIVILLKDIVNAKPILFPPNAQANYVGKDVTLTGWGHTKATPEAEMPPKNHDPPGVLQEVIVKVLPDSTCKTKYKHEYTDSMICEGHLPGGKGHCSGDSGGPVVYYDTENRKSILVGVQSSNAACAIKDIPSVSAKITAGLAWIEKICSGIKKA